ncbi:hypothetical protein Agub_g2577 [Astrephomene gubernaculifera]|uniref:Myeloid leukemia factor n=1 Tax=Astrephomene gubernaculifera TaxID=47775 RepID=A0AAD3DJC3_9CHLO|nr:hypothetical protein Agub_g2577 [Astrephomene gubernaculifera]
MFGRGGPFGGMFGGDPFMSDPFSQMDRMINSMFADPLFGNPLGVGLRPPGTHIQQQSHQQRARQPVIEEVDDDGQPVRATANQDEPIVEEPDDVPAAAKEGSPPQSRAAQRPRRHSPPRASSTHVQGSLDPFGQLFGALTGGAAAGGGNSSFVFSSSSFSSLGPGGVSYQTTTSTRVGPGGVRETQSVVRDGRSGTEAVTISRGLGDGRQRTLVRTRDAITGREEQVEDLQGITADEADVFDDQWRQHAERNLPGSGAFGAVAGRLGAGPGAGGSRSQRTLALPSTAGGGGISGHHSAAAMPSASLYDSAPAAPSSHQAQPGVGYGRRHSSSTGAYFPPSSGGLGSSGPAGAGVYGGGTVATGGGSGGQGSYTGHGPGTPQYGSRRFSGAGQNSGYYSPRQQQQQQHQQQQQQQQQQQGAGVGSGRSGMYGGSSYAGGGQTQPRYHY